MELVTTLNKADPKTAQTWITQAREIFFETAGNPKFPTPSERDQFQERYFDTYLGTPEFFYLALRDQKILGYLAGARRTLTSHFNLNPYLEKFRTPIETSYPAHLHINLSSGAQGGGIGSRLLSSFESELKGLGTKGVHIVTSASARNISFYQKNHYLPIERSEWNGRSLLLMGKTLN
jgi:GNAT superfamily N-acetyltransferase